MDPSPAKDIKALAPDELAAALEGLGEPRYRAGQLVRWLHQRGVVSFNEMTDVPVSLREALAGRFALSSLTLAERQVSADGTRKYLYSLYDAVEVESVGMPTSDRLTVCFSTQAGCAMGCSFCATGAGGFVRDLSLGEMVDQVRLVGADFGRRVTNAVAMGQGEPFNNYDATMAALRLMNSADGLGIGARHLTISTCGLIGGIRRFATEPEQFTLAVSLHSAIQETRDVLMPGVRGQALPELREALVAYSGATGRRFTLEFALIAGANDSAEELDALVGFTRGLLAHVNLIPVNPVDHTRVSPASQKRVRAFREALSRAGVEVSVRAERGSDIQAACGQLAQVAKRVREAD